MKNQIDLMPVRIAKNRVKRLNSGGYPSYPAVDDIYNKFREKKDINPKDVSKTKDPFESDKIKALREKYLLDEMCGNYLDIPESGSYFGQGVIRMKIMKKLLRFKWLFINRTNAVKVL
ncbi:MAG: hypothetical protein WCQ95_12855 [Bacteroidota bacterium]